jgi:hypothetical protein
MRLITWAFGLALLGLGEEGGTWLPSPSSQAELATTSPCAELVCGRHNRVAVPGKRCEAPAGLQYNDQDKQADFHGDHRNAKGGHPKLLIKEHKKSKGSVVDSAARPFASSRPVVSVRAESLDVPGEGVLPQHLLYHLVAEGRACAGSSGARPSITANLGNLNPGSCVSVVFLSSQRRVAMLGQIGPRSLPVSCWQCAGRLAEA